MENLNKRIKSESARHLAKIFLPKTLAKKLQIEKKKLHSDFDAWIINLKISMHLCKYRQVIGEIEARKIKFKKIPEVHWKYQCLEVEAIFKLLKKKIFKRKNDISKEGSHNYNSCLFWFNQIYILLEQLVLEIRFDVNATLNGNDINLLRPIQHIIDCFIKFCYILLIFSQYNHQIPEMLSYLSMIERIVPYMKFTPKSSSFIYLQKIIVFKVKILMENCDYLNAIDYLESNINFGFNYIKLLSDENFNVYEFDLSNERIRKYLSNLSKRRLFNNFNYKELLSRNENNKNKNLLGINKISRKELIALNEQKLKNFENNNELNKNTPRKFLKSNKLEPIDEKKNTSSFSEITNNSNSTNNNLNNLQIKKTDSHTSKKKLKTMKSIKSNNSSQSLTEENRNRNRSFSLNKKRTLKKIFIQNKPIIEEVLSCITLNFYFRAAIFEHVGNIDSALDSYKEVEWLSVKFLTTKFPFFVKYITSLLNCAWNNYNIIYKLKYEKEKIRQRNEILKNIELIKHREKIRAQERINKELLSYKSTKLYNNRKLNNFLKNLGDKIYKEDEQRNFNIYSNFSKTKFILSTYQMIDDLMSDELIPVLKRMKKVNITKQNEEIKDQIDKALMKRQHELSIKQHNSKINISINKSNINNNNNNFNNTKNSSINVKDSISSFKNIQKNKIILFKPIKTKLLRHKIKLNKRAVDSSKSRYQNNSSKKISSSAEISMINYKNSTSLPSCDERISNLLKKKLLMNRSKIESEKTYNKLYRTKSDFKNMNLLSKTFRSTYRKEKVEKYIVSKDTFNKSVIKKKFFLDKFSSKEYNFLKNLLKTKSYLPEVVRPIDDLGLKKVRQDADLSFNTKMELVKSGTDKKNLTNLIKQNYNAGKKKKNKNKDNLNGDEIQTDQSENYIIFDNNEKLRQIENDYYQILTRRSLLIKRKKKLNNSIM